jgi:glyoxylase-like metal-dependent hydrolase (beta-lactamase superfamily II)
MIHVEQHGPVVAIRMARALFGRPLEWTAAYWIDGLLVDTGPRCTARQLLRVLEPLQVERIVITHSHEDCIGGLADVHAKYPQASVFASRHAIPLIQNPAKAQVQLYRRLMWGIPRGVESVRTLDDVDNVVYTYSYRFRVIETPGHSRDHISLYEPSQRWIFSGDAYSGGQERNWATDFDFFAVVSSLRTLASLRPERLFTGTGSVRRTPLPDLHDKIGSLVRLSKEVAKLDASGMSVSEMVNYLFRGESALRVWTNGHFSAANLIEACRSYNALMSPDTDWSAYESVQGGSGGGGTAGSIDDSSENESADRGDVVR